MTDLISPHPLAITPRQTDMLRAAANAKGPGDSNNITIKGWLCALGLTQRNAPNIRFNAVRLVERGLCSVEQRSGSAPGYYSITPKGRAALTADGTYTPDAPSAPHPSSPERVRARTYTAHPDLVWPLAQPPYYRNAGHGHIHSRGVAC